MECRLFGYGVPAHACFSPVIRRGRRIREFAPPQDLRKDKYLLNRSHRSLPRRSRVSGGFAPRYFSERLPPAFVSCCLQKAAWWSVTAPVPEHEDLSLDRGNNSRGASLLNRPLQKSYSVIKNVFCEFVSTFVPPTGYNRTVVRVRLSPPKLYVESVMHLHK